MKNEKRVLFTRFGILKVLPYKPCKYIMTITKSSYEIAIYFLVSELRTESFKEEKLSSFK